MATNPHAPIVVFGPPGWHDIVALLRFAAREMETQGVTVDGMISARRAAWLADRIHGQVKAQTE